MNSDHNPTSAHITSNSMLLPTINAWRYYLEDQGSSIHTIKAFLADMKLLASYLPPDRNLGKVSTQDIHNFLDWMQNVRGVPCSPKTLARRITSIKAFFRWLHNNGIILMDPAEKVPQKSVTSPLPTVLNPEEATLILEIANRHRHSEKPDARSYTLVALLLATGIKKSECLGLSPNHLDLDAQPQPLLFVRYADPKYRYKERKIPLPTEWVAAYQEYQQQYQLDERLFPWSQRRLEYLLEDLSNEAALEKHLSFEMCRWTCALMDWREGVDQGKIRHKLGVSNIQWREIRIKLERLANVEA